MHTRSPKSPPNRPQIAPTAFSPIFLFSNLPRRRNVLFSRSVSRTPHSDSSTPDKRPTEEILRARFEDHAPTHTLYIAHSPRPLTHSSPTRLLLRLLSNFKFRAYTYDYIPVLGTHVLYYLPLLDVPSTCEVSIPLVNVLLSNI